MEVRWIRQGDVQYPVQLVRRMGDAAPAAIATSGNLEILRHKLIGLICSVQCPGSIVIKTFDVIRKLRDAQVAMIGGFHSPMERECLDLLLRGAQPIVLCQARSLRRSRIGRTARQAMADGRLLIISPFGEQARRTTSAQARERNELVAALAEVVFVPHASPNGKTWVAVRGALERGQKVFSLEDEANTALLEWGARTFRSDYLNDLISAIGKS